MILKKIDLDAALALIARSGQLYVPGEVLGVSRFVGWGGETLFDYSNTVMPPKDILFPNTQVMYNYTTGVHASIEEVTQDTKQTVFGIRPCDMRGVECMDKVFLEKSYTDSFYSRKRESTTFIALACTAPAATCFCDSMGIDPAAAPAADVLLREQKDSYEVTAQTDKGREVIKLWGELLHESSENSKSSAAACTLKVKMNKDIPEKLSKMSEHTIWDSAGRACIGCATCTYACPTCYCFDMSSDTHGSEGTAFRCWDSCMFSDYTRMAGGHNPRPTKKERVRNRYMHKLSYFHQRYGMVLCTGCGRCLEKCPQGLDITEFIDNVAEVSL